MLWRILVSSRPSADSLSDMQTPTLAAQQETASQRLEAESFTSLYQLNLRV